ncbi:MULTISPECIES: ABC transporter ATP-binding protein [Streptomyces]|uniref:ABC transporter ATP-binding protein n=1 Tax=Streptomyces TaxID=1883 RepID=UPI00068E569A|nr:MULTISPECIES: ABC transporter ATP-binding protein [Streptomyces]
MAENIQNDDTATVRPHSTVRSLLRLWPYARAVRGRLAVSVTAATLGMLSTLAVPVILGRIVDGPLAEHDLAALWPLVGLLLLVGLVEAGLFFTRRVVLARPLAGLETAMRGDLFAKLQRLPVSFHDRWGSGQLLSRATADMYTMRLFLAFPLVFLIVNSVMFLAGAVVMFSQDWRLALIALLPVVPLFVLTRRFEAGYSGSSRLAQDQNGDLATVVEESVLGIRILKAFGRHRSMAERFRAQSQELRRTELRKAHLLANLWAVIVGLPELALGGALAVGAYLVAHDELSAGTLVAFLSTALALRWPVESLGWLLAYANEAATATDRFFEVLDEPDTQDRGTATGGPVRRILPDQTAALGCVHRKAEEGVHAEHRRPTTTQRGACPGVAGPAGSAGQAPAAPDGIRFTGVRFRYPDAPEDSPDLLTDIDLHIRSGETMALVGATGSGKTTLTALLPRLYEATAGAITLDGRDIRDLPRERLRELVAVAFEEPTLFSATVRENVLMGAPGASAEQLRSALATAQAGFVDKLPEGADTEVGEQGLSLSGGQRQRLALARAVVGDPAFLVLDDPLSALDVHTEALVERALREVLGTTTALVVAHRPSTVLLADRVAVLADGRITAVGTHQELLRDCPHYRELMSGEAALVSEGSTAP